MDITLHFGLSPEIFYVSVKEVNGPPYGKAYGHFKQNLNKKEKSIVLGDDDVINLVNLKFTSEYYNCPPEEVIRMREEARSFVEINGKIKNAKNKEKAKNNNKNKIKVTKKNWNKKGKR